LINLTNKIWLFQKIVVCLQSKFTKQQKMYLIVDNMICGNGRAKELAGAGIVLSSGDK